MLKKIITRGFEPGTPGLQIHAFFRDSKSVSFSLKIKWEEENAAMVSKSISQAYSRNYTWWRKRNGEGCLDGKKGGEGKNTSGWHLHIVNWK